MITLAKSWRLATDFIGNDTDLIESLTIHSYDADISEKYHRKFNQMKLVDCVELDLKTLKIICRLLNVYLNYQKLKNYLETYVIPLPADFPGQLFIRRAIVNKLEFESESPIQKEITHLIPFMGPLHVSLNTRESSIYHVSSLL